MSISILLVVFSLYVYSSCRDMISAIDEQYRGRALSIIATVDAIIDNEADLNDKDQLQRTCDNLIKTKSHVQKVSLYMIGKDGRVIRVASSNHDQIGKEADRHDAIPIKDRRIVWEDKLKGEKGHVAEILAPIYVDGKPRASFGIYMDLKPKDAAIRQYILRTIIYALAGLVFIALLLYAVIWKEVFKPLRQLTEGAREVASGNLNKRVNLGCNGELGDLSQEFDNMAEALQRIEQGNLHLQEALRERWRKVEMKASTDYLTGLENHRIFHDKLEVELSRASRLGKPMSLLFCDLDKFNVFNDINGHLFGDKALLDVARIIKSSVRDYDIVARYGGEEFAVILPHTDSDGAVSVGERIRKNVEAHKFTTGNGVGKLMISVGVATYPRDANKKALLIAAADSAMSESKKRGGNSVVLFKSFGSVNSTKAS
ncbi:MAG: diguanylate cyclase [Actinobacteria bacterium]|nr:diguanylate cyclase [Actinomycetota bacterium]